MSVKRNGSGSGENGGGGDAPSDDSGVGATSTSGETLDLDRRDFLKLVGSSMSAAAAASCAPDESGTAATDTPLHIDGNLPVDFSFRAVRREDLVDLRFDFVNLVPEKHNRSLRRKVSGSPTLVIVNFPAQHVFEPAFRETEVDNPGTLPSDPEVPISARVSGESRVAFIVPDSVGSIPLTLEGLLALLGQLELHVAKNALPPPEAPAVLALQLPAGPNGKSKTSRTARLLRYQRLAYAKKHWLPPVSQAQLLEEESTDPPSLPFNHETALEIPFRLLLSPNRHGAWAHATTPVAGSSGRFELWHSRLGTRVGDSIDERDPTLRRVRALWSRDPGFDPNAPDDPVTDTVFSGPIELETLISDDRSQIVHLTSNFERFPDSTENPEDPLPRPVNVNQLMLTSMGGWLDVRGDWADNSLTGGVLGALEEWQHRATQGRDHFVKVVHKGLLFPFGHRASRVDISERKFKVSEHEHVAYLRKRTFIIVREPLKQYDAGRDPTDSDPVPANLRKLPFNHIKVTTVTTPSLDIVDGKDDHFFIPKVGGTFDPNTNEFTGGTPFRFEFEAMDDDGNLITYSAPVVWIRATHDPALGVDLPIDPADIAAADDLYNGAVAGGLTEEERKCVLAGQRFAYAPSNQADDTALETQSITFQGFEFDGILSGEELEALQRAYPNYFPELESAELALESARAVSGQAENITRKYVFHDQFFNHGFSEADNAGELLLTLAAGETTVPVTFGEQTDRSGGFLSPNFEIAAVSRRIGPISGDPNGDAVDGTFNPSEFFANLIEDALPKLFGVFSLADILSLAGVDLSQAPKYITQILPGPMGAIADLERLVETLRSVSVDVETELASIETLFNDLEAAFQGDEDAIGRLTADIAGVVGDLGTLPTILNGVTINPLALKTDLLDRAQRLANTLNGAVTQILEIVENLADGIELPTEIRTHLEWRGKVRAWDTSGVFENFFVPYDPNLPEESEDLDEADALLLSADIVAKAEGEAQLNLKCSLENFKVRLFGDSALFLILKFDLLEFSVQNGKKPDVRLLFNDNGIQFAGPLKFIETLKRMIPLDGFSDPPNLDVGPEGITASFSIALPNVAVGVLSLENIVLAASLRIPFIGDPLSFSFAFSTRENPFNLTVSLLGGGGFFGLELTPKGVKMLEASLEAGARISIDLGVASGSVSAMIGIYFRIEKLSDTENRLLLTGYFRLRGQVDVLGLISVSITLTLELTYQAEPVNKLYGRATLEIEIEIAFFSASVTITCERRFAGSNGDPTFFEVMAPEGDYRPWDDYVAAFAA